MQATEGELETNYIAICSFGFTEPVDIIFLTLFIGAAPGDGDHTPISRTEIGLMMLCFPVFFSLVGDAGPSSSDRLRPPKQACVSREVIHFLSSEAV